MRKVSFLLAPAGLSAFGTLAQTAPQGEDATVTEIKRLSERFFAGFRVVARKLNNV